MTHFESPPTAPTYESQSAPDSTTGDDPSVKDKAADAAEQGKQAATEVASDAVDRAGDVKDEAVRQARDLAGEARDQLSKHAGGQQQNLVTNLRSLGQELGSMTGASETPGVATELVSQAKERVDGVADWLDGREPQQILDDVRTFARRRPGAFLLGAAAAGLLTGRLTRGVVAAHADSDRDDSAATGTSDRAVIAPPSTPAASAGGYSSPPTDDQSAGYGAEGRQGIGYSAPSYAGTEPVTQGGYGSDVSAGQGDAEGGGFR